MSTQQQMQIQSWLDQASSLVDAGLTHQARPLVRQVISLMPEHPSARRMLASIELASHEPARALAALDMQDLYHPSMRDDPQQQLVRAIALWQTCEDGLALSLLERMTEAYPDDLRPRQLQAQILLEAYRNGQGDKLPDAIEALRHVLRLAPGDEASRSQLVDMLAQHDPLAAAQVLEEGMAAPGGLVVPVCQAAADLLRLARLYRQADHLRDAQETYRQLLLIQRQDPAVWMEAASLDMELGAARLAIERIELAMACADCDQLQAWQLLAQVNMRSGQLAAAGRLWWRVHRADGNHVQAMAGLIVCALALGRQGIVKRVHRDFAIHASREERRQAVTAMWARAAGGMVIAQQLRHDQKVQSSAEPVGHGSLLAPIISRAVTTLHEHATQHPGRADAHYHLAMCQMASGNKAEAAESVDEALRINPRYLAAAKLGATLHAQGWAAEPMRQVA